MLWLTGKYRKDQKFLFLYWLYGVDTQKEVYTTGVTFALNHSLVASSWVKKFHKSKNIGNHDLHCT